MQGTSYDNQHGAGYCSYQISRSTSLPWHHGVRYWVATGQYAASRICGLCVAFHGTQEAGSPIPTTVQYAQSGSQAIYNVHSLGSDYAGMILHAADVIAWRL